MYLKEIIDKVGESINDKTLMSTGVNASRTKGWIQQFYFLELLPRADWNFAKKEGTITTTSGTQRYNFPRWVDNPTRVTDIVHPTSYTKLSQADYQDIVGKYNLTVYADPSEYVLGPRTRTTYTTGTISGTAGAKIITGSSTAWLSSNITQFDYIQVGSYAYVVDSVDSNTQITVFEDIATTFSASTYTAILDRWTIDFYPVPNATLAMIVRGKQIVPRLDDNYDIPILPDNWHWILVKAGIVKARQHNQEDVQIELVELEAAIKRLVSEDQSESDRVEYIGIPRSRTY